MTNESQSYEMRVEWENNPYEAPFLTNQMSISSGPDTQFGPDDLFYLRLGHVVAPMVTPGHNEYVLRVNSGGTFALSLSRIKELQRMLDVVVEQAEALKNQQQDH